MRRFSGRLSTCAGYRRLCAFLAFGLIVSSIPAVAEDRTLPINNVWPRSKPSSMS